MTEAATARLPEPACHVEQALNDLGAQGIAIQSGFLDEDRRRILLERVLEQAELERFRQCLDEVAPEDFSS